MASQRHWRACVNCFGLFFNGHPTKGVCPADKAFFSPHATSLGASVDAKTYRLEFADTTNPPKTQRHWR
ncbi:hypothetical protein [Bradyrhizobium lablabi]|uniref:hypothetical protein n=1 Tax=Bradyrhizobium lablabi TaxID=722472 RepID=UPI001BABAF88|nr:hypothetical protein [Bradyrhizobium lablabi]MBR0695276.1 hypothetical protein [Bradyrhizobium lablabi]